jgi:rhomboid protease GluP
MLTKGALSWYYIVEYKEYYRVVTSIFMHADWSHLVNNMIVLLFIGGNLERVIGKWKYLIIYFAGGILAGITSIGYNMWKEYADVVAFYDTTISIGASGAIFALVGAVLFIVLINKGRLKEISMRQMVWFVFLSLYGGIANSGIDQAAHVGGFLAGIILAVILYRRKTLHEN